MTKVTPFAMAAVRPEEAKPSAESEARLTAAAKTVPPKSPDLPPAAHRTQTSRNLAPAAELALAAISEPPPAPAPPSATAPSGAPRRRDAQHARAEPSSEPPDQRAAPRVDERRRPPAHAIPTIAPPPGTSHFSMAEMWPEPERDSVRQTETLIGARGRARRGLACDLLLTRVLASAASLVGAAEAPRDPALVSLLLGLDGRRYLAFRASVRAARQKEEVSVREALECFSFVLEARAARETLGR